MTRKRASPRVLPRPAVLAALLPLLWGACTAPSRDDVADARTDERPSPADSANAVTPSVPSLPGVLAVVPTDEAPRDATLRATRDTLLAIVRRRDTVALAAHLDPAVKYSFGDSDGRAGFFAFWRETASLDALWTTLEDVLTHGGRFVGPALFSAPWTFSALPDSLDAFTHVVVRERSVPVYATPADTGVPLGTVSHTVLAARGAPDGAWWPVTLPDGRLAFADTVRVRSPIGYRVGLGRKGDRWVIQYVVAGD